MGIFHQTPLKKSYFSLILSSMKQAYDTNETSPENQIICLQKKNFDTMTMTATHKFNTKNPPQIDWKKHFLNYYLEGYLSEYDWAKELYLEIQSQSFPQQTKFQSHFFYQEFFILTCPKQIKHFAKNNANDDSNIIGYGNINSSTDDVKNSHLNLSNNLFGSFSSVENSLIGSTDISGEYRKNRTKIGEYLKIFKQHLFTSSHPIFIIVGRFNYWFSSHIKETINFLGEQKNEANYEQLLEEETSLIIEQIKAFIIELQIVTKLFYSKAISFTFFIDEKDEFINLVTNLVFKEGKLYESLYSLFKLKYEKDIILFEKKLFDFKDIKPEDIGVKDKYCLNAKTKSYQDHLMKESYKNKKEESKDFDIDNKNKIIIELDKKINDEEIESQDNNIQMQEDTHGDRLNSMSQIPELIVSSESSKLLQFTSQKTKKYDANYDVPYYQAIRLLKSISEYRAPFEKLIIIASLSAEITVCVNNYWKNMKKIISPSLLSIDADELMTIYIYLIIHSQMPEIFIHSAFVKYFTTSYTKSNMVGYYYSTLEGSLEFLLSINTLNDFFSDTPQGNPNEKTEEVKNDNENDNEKDNDNENDNNINSIQ